jgi:hypothetical protein
MSNVRDGHFIREENAILLTEADHLRIKNKQLYRLILQLVSELDELEDSISAAAAATATSKPKTAR